MYNYNKGSQFIAYDNAAANISKTRQVVMLFDGMISFVRRAREAMKERNFQDQFNHLDRTSRIITALHSSLDFSNGGEVAKALENFYNSLFMRTMELVRTHEERPYDDLAHDLKAMRDAWEHVDRSASEQENSDKISQESMAQVVDEAVSAGISLSV